MVRDASGSTLPQPYSRTSVVAGSGWTAAHAETRVRVIDQNLRAERRVDCGVCPVRRVECRVRVCLVCTPSPLSARRLFELMSHVRRDREHDPSPTS